MKRAALTCLTNQGFGKLREPIVRMAQVLRAFNFSCTCNKFPLYWMDSPAYALGQNPYRASNVFNFFEPGLSASRRARFRWLGRPGIPNHQRSFRAGDVEFSCADSSSPAFNGIPNIPPLLGDYSSLAPMAANPTQLVEHLNLLLLSGQMSTALKNSLISEIGKMSTDPIPRVKEAVHSIITSPEYVIQK